MAKQLRVELQLHVLVRAGSHFSENLLQLLGLLSVVDNGDGSAGLHGDILLQVGGALVHRVGSCRTGREHLARVFCENIFDPLKSPAVALQGQERSDLQVLGHSRCWAPPEKTV